MMCSQYPWGKFHWPPWIKVVCSWDGDVWKERWKTGYRRRESYLSILPGKSLLLGRKRTWSWRKRKMLPLVWDIQKPIPPESQVCFSADSRSSCCCFMDFALISCLLFLSWGCAWLRHCHLLCLLHTQLWKVWFCWEMSGGVLQMPSDPMKTEQCTRPVCKKKWHEKVWTSIYCVWQQ